MEEAKVIFNEEYLTSNGYSKTDIFQILVGIYIQYTELTHESYSGNKLPQCVDTHLYCLRALIEASCEPCNLVLQGRE